MPQETCLFCQISSGKIPTDLLYQDDFCVVIRDINPQAPSHLLVIPREHIESLDDASHRDETLLGHLLRIGARVINQEGHSETGYRAVINNGAGAGQSVFHLHVHVLGGRAMRWPPG